MQQQVPIPHLIPHLSHCHLQHQPAEHPNQKSLALALALLIFGDAIYCIQAKQQELTNKLTALQKYKTKGGRGTGEDEVGSKEIKQQVDGEEEGRGLTHGSTSQGARAEASRDGGERRRRRRWRLVAGGRRPTSGVAARCMGAAMSSSPCGTASVGAEDKVCLPGLLLGRAVSGSRIRIRWRIRLSQK